MFRTKDAALEANNALDQTFKELDDGFKDLQGSLPALSALEKIFINLCLNLSLLFSLLKNNVYVK